MKRYFYYLLFVFAIFACKKDEEMIVGDPIGLISFEEFIATEPPTYQEFLDAFEQVTQATPGLLNDPDLLARNIFDYIRDNRPGNGRLSKGEVFDLLFRLTVEEWRVVLSNPIDAGLSLSTVGLSIESAVEKFPCDDRERFDGTKADALRHAFWNALMADRSNGEFAEAMATAHESAPDNDERSKAMDLHNNRFGRNIQRQFTGATDEEYLTLLLEQKYIYVGANEAFPDSLAGLVYIEGKRAYDVTMTGSISNPDSGGDWNITLTMHQCNDMLRGRFDINRGQESQQRRFSGTLDGNTVNLDVSAPFSIENPLNLSYCRNMKMVLTGDENTLTGAWSASNCPRGGVINLSQ